MRFLLTDIDAEKICQFQSAKIVSCIVLKSESPGNVKSSIKEIKRVIEELRRELQEIESISLSGAKKISSWPYFVYPYAVIEIKAKGIEFQVAFFPFEE
jgi:hypothetical protein